MKNANAATIAFINAARNNPDAPIAFADCFTFSLPSGLVLTYTNVDRPVTYNGAVFAANGPLVQGLKFKSAVGLEVDKQQIIIAARPTDLLAGAMFLNALRDGAFDGCIIQRDRVFMSALGQPPAGGVRYFMVGFQASIRSGAVPQRLQSRQTSCCSTWTCRAAFIQRHVCTRSMILGAWSFGELTPPTAWSAQDRQRRSSIGLAPWPDIRRARYCLPPASTPMCARRRRASLSGPRSC